MTELPKLPFDLPSKRVYVAGHKGMVGAAVVRRLGSEACQILTADRTTVDLRHQADTNRWLDRAKPHVVIVAAARVGGIAYSNANPVQFLSDNLAIAFNPAFIPDRRHSRCARTCWQGSNSRG